MPLDPRRIVIHHTVTAEDASAAHINRLHRQRGFSGIGYHAIVRRAAGGDVIIEDGRDDENQGAHAKGANYDTLGVAVAGDFSEQEPDDQQYGILIGQCAAWCLTYGIGSNDIFAHKHVPGGKTATVCPGLIDIERVKRCVAAILQSYAAA